jgi:hypothetical protein
MSPEYQPKWTAWTALDSFKLNKAVPFNPLILQAFQSIGQLGHLTFLLLL